MNDKAKLDFVANFLTDYSNEINKILQSDAVCNTFKENFEDLKDTLGVKENLAQIIFEELSVEGDEFVLEPGFANMTVDEFNNNIGAKNKFKLAILDNDNYIVATTTSFTYNL